MLEGVASLPPLIPALQNIGILHHKKGKLRINLQQSVCTKDLKYGIGKSRVPVGM